MKTMRASHLLATSSCHLLHSSRKRPAWNRNIHSAVQEFATSLGETQPCFAIRARDIRILSKPMEFQALLLKMIHRARRRIFLSSLYIGESEQYLIDSLDQSLKSNPSLQVYLTLDYNRSTRPGPKSTASLLVPLLEKHPSRVHVHLFKSPKLKGLLARYVPRRFDEGWGTWHAKIYGVDDEVLISGANLNESYFTDRQDRYLHFASSRLSDYCTSFLKAVAPFCYQLRSLPSSSESISPAETNYSLHWQDSTMHPERIEEKLGERLRSFQNQEQSFFPLRDVDPEAAKNNALLFPIIQGGQFGVREEERCISMLFQHLGDSARKTGEIPLVDLTSGYFGLSKAYQELVRTSPVDCRIVCASPKANGFYGSKGISGRIPEGYTLLEQRFWRGVSRSHREWKANSLNDNEGHGVQLQEWTRPGWTYHAKGVWVSPNQGAPPILTLFGSTNLNSRSANLDTELAFVMILPSPGGDNLQGDDGDRGEDASGVMALRTQLADEVRGLRQHAVPWMGEARKVRFGTKVIVSLVGGML